MEYAKILEYLQKKYCTDNVKYLGHGTDSTAYVINDTYVCRFPHHGVNIYETEAAICDYIRPNISIKIPQIEFINDSVVGGYAVHKMIVGNKWSWHKFAYSSKQNNLADSIALFLAQLHKTNIGYIKNNMNVPTIKYVPFDRIENTIRPFLPKILIKRLKNKYNQIIQTTRQDDDFVLCHMGLKGPNSVVDDAGQLCGVFDFGNAGIYERWCDLAVICTSKNRRLMNRVLRKYSQYSGVKINKKRINDMILMEAFWAKRWHLENNGEYTCGNDWQTAKTCARCLSVMYGIPYLMRKIILMPLICLYAHMYKKTVHV